MPVYSICVSCGRQFLADRVGRKFCSPSCYHTSLCVPKTPLSERFWSKVEKSDGCWLWTGQRNAAGYGVLDVEGRPQLAHRIAYRLKHGEIPEGIHILHHCDNPPCVRDDHLFAGTNSENIADMLQKKRWAVNGPRRRLRGESHPSSRYTADVIERLLKRRAEGATIPALSDEFGMSTSQVHRVIAGKTWKHIPRPT